MKILWFTNTPSNASAEFGYLVYGGGWISSLETLISENEKYQLGICFFYNGTDYKKVIKNHVVYYGIPLQMGNAIQRIFTRQSAKLNDEDQSFIDRIIEDFTPDLIHVFGTEMGYGKLLMNRAEKVLYHLQGLVLPYSEVYFPLGFSKIKVLRKSTLNSILRGLTLFHDYKMLKKRAKREKEIIKYWKYFAGRTDWDGNYIRLLNPDAQYFHCDELLRKEFFENEWLMPSETNIGQEIIIGTTINPNLYKGLDLVYNTINLIGGKSIRWKIFGISENDDLNRIVKSVLGIHDKHPNIVFYGQICAEELVKELKTCHFFVHPSYIDNSPNSVCEAMLLGMPVLSSSVGGVRSLIINKETGFLFNPYDKYDLAGLLVNLIDNYDIARQTGTNARKAALKRHSPDKIISEIDYIYEKIFNDTL